MLGSVAFNVLFDWGCFCSTRAVKRPSQSVMRSYPWERCVYCFGVWGCVFNKKCQAAVLVCDEILSLGALHLLFCFYVFFNTNGQTTVLVYDEILSLGALRFFRGIFFNKSCQTSVLVCDEILCLVALRLFCIFPVMLI